MSTAIENIPLPNGHTPSTEPIQPPPEIEATLSRLSAYRNVRGVMILSRSTIGSTSAVPSGTGGIVQSTGSVFEGEGGKKYARVVEGLASSVSVAVGECDEGVSVSTSYVDMVEYTMPRL